MNTDVNFHPSPDLLNGFAEGTLAAGKCVAISAHVELCDSCRLQITELEAAAAASWAQEAEPAIAPAMLDFSEQPQQQSVTPTAVAVGEFHMLDHSVSLPRVLAKAAASGLVWKKLAGGINQAAVTLDDQTQCEFIYMKPGSQVPVHRRMGSELTLVLDGSFSDELGHYGASDFVMRSSEHTHSPASDEGCLCFTVLDSPLTFTSGLARLLNPILRYRFNRAISQRA